MDTDTLKNTINYNQELRELRPLVAGSSIERERWEVIFPRAAQQLELGDPVESNRSISDAGESAGGIEVAEFEVGDRVRIVSPGVNDLGLPVSCDITSPYFYSFNVGETVTVIEECRHGNRFCIRAENGNRGCAVRAQLEPLGRANE